MIFGIGLSKTGTQSLAQALSMLGYPCVHYPSPALMLEGAFEKAFEGSLGGCDISVSAFYQQLAGAYPESRFILTTRRMDAWVESVGVHMRYVIEHAPHELVEGDPKGEVRLRCFGTRGFSEGEYREAYERHIVEVNAYFAHQPERLLVVDLTCGDGWAELCPFLGCEIPELPFPHRNSRSEPTSASFGA
jgi:Sulfotransferase domain